MNPEKLLNKAVTNQDLNIDVNPFQYSSEYKDRESNLVYLRARYYSPDIQQFIQRDSANLLNDTVTRMVIQ